MLNDHGGLKILGNLLDAINRRQGLGTIGVECRHTVAFVVFTKMRKIAAEQDVAHPRELDQQDVMARGMPGRVQHKHSAIAEYIPVQQQGFDLAVAADPIGQKAWN